MMFKKIAFTAPLAILALGSSMAFGADESRQTINIIAKVPTTSFYVRPSPGLTDQIQDMSPQSEDGALKDINGHFDMRATGAKIAGKLISSPVLYAMNSNKQVLLKVTVNNKEMTLTSEEIVNEADSNDNFRALLNITTNTAGPVASGDYSGDVKMLFEPVITSL
ncbi:MULTISPECIES: CS1 type fimbrial major subunit [unclassified Pseudomonas]|jgi:hypothetical protein|uniref:CS1 type fimbrial major subunit n=1 Tax=unclassified Pseudomonas TaxID=196821 RepID=UPI00069EC713|nr:MULTISPECIES: CS1 type fimbrial major subunit [unclassified Pseudomonas]WPN48170.1 CS1 type fimbrial major subunit [Pseudomonas sp. P8_241]